MKEVADNLYPPTDKTIKIRGVEYKVTGSGDDVKYTRTSDNQEFDKTEFTSEVGISDLVINPDGSYVFKFNNTTYKFDKDHNPIEEP